MKKILTIILIILSTVVVATEEEPHAVAFEEGKAYKRLPSNVVADKVVQALSAKHPGKAVVIEFFSYGCVGCMRLHPFIDKWIEKKPDNVVFYRFPVLFNKQWEVLARAYYINKAESSLQISDQDFFTTIYKHRIKLSEKSKLAEFFREHGLPEERFNELYASFAVEQELVRAKEVAKAYRVLVSPTVIVSKVNGSYEVTPNMVKGNCLELTHILTYLVSS